MNYKDLLLKHLQKHFIEELANTEMQISKDLEKYLIPTLLKCLNRATHLTLDDMKKVLDLPTGLKENSDTTKTPALGSGLFDDKSKY